MYTDPRIIIIKNLRAVVAISPDSENPRVLIDLWMPGNEGIWEGKCYTVPFPFHPPSLSPPPIPLPHAQNVLPYFQSSWILFILHKTSLTTTSPWKNSGLHKSVRMKDNTLCIQPWRETKKVYFNLVRRELCPLHFIWGRGLSERCSCWEIIDIVHVINSRFLNY